MSTGELVVCRAAMKPLATLNRPVLTTVDVETKEETVSFKERTDVTAVPAMGVVAETMVALVLAGEALRKFGGDSLAEVVRNQSRLRGDPARCLSPTPHWTHPPWTGATWCWSGLMGVGKSTVGRRLAKELGRPFADVDEQVELHAGVTIPTIFRDAGRGRASARPRRRLRRPAAPARAAGAGGRRGCGDRRRQPRRAGGGGRVRRVAAGVGRVPGRAHRPHPSAPAGRRPRVHARPPARRAHAALRGGGRRGGRRRAVPHRRREAQARPGPPHRRPLVAPAPRWARRPGPRAHDRPHGPVHAAGQAYPVVVGAGVRGRAGRPAAGPPSAGWRW